MCADLTAPALRASAPPVLRSTAVIRPPPPGRAGQQKAARLPGLRRAGLPRPALTRSPCAVPPPTAATSLRGPVPPGQRLLPHAWRHLRRADLPGPAKSRQAYAEQNAPLLLFFLHCPRLLSRLATRPARLFLVVLLCCLLPRVFL